MVQRASPVHIVRIVTQYLALLSADERPKTQVLCLERVVLEAGRFFGLRISCSPRTMDHWLVNLSVI